MADRNEGSELLTMYESMIKDEDLALALRVNRGFRVLGVVQKIEQKLKERQENKEEQAIEEPEQEIENEEEVEEEAPKPVPKIKPLPIKPKLPMLNQVQKQMRQQQTQQPQVQKPAQAEVAEDDDFPSSDEDFP